MAHPSHTANAKHTIDVGSIELHFMMVSAIGWCGVTLGNGDTGGSALMTGTGRDANQPTQPMRNCIQKVVASSAIAPAKSNQR